MIMEVALRGYADDDLLFEHIAVLESEYLGTLVINIIRAHAKALSAHAIHEFEIEFLEEPDETVRYYRFRMADPKFIQDAFKLSPKAPYRLQ